MVKNVSPFRFGQIVDSSNFTNRSNEIALLNANLLSGNHVIIISPRRYGKSSLVQQFINLEQQNTEVIHCVIDLFGIQNEETFYESLAREVIKASSNKFEEWIQIAKTLFKNLIPRISVGTDPQNDFSISFDFKEIEKHKSEILNLPEAIATRKKKRIIIYFDEFQEIALLNKSPDFQKLLRSNWQKQKNVSYCMYGSKRHMLSEIFDQTDKPFYRFGSKIMLDRIATTNWETFLTNLFIQTNKTISKKMVLNISGKMNNHPHYVQQLAHYVWSFSDKKVTPDVLDYALEFMLNSNTPFFIKTIEELSKTQVNLLKAISAGEKQLTSGKTMQNYKLGTPRNVSKNKNTLEKKDIIDITPDQILFIDPLFEMWFKKNSR